MYNIYRPQYTQYRILTTKSIRIEKGIAGILEMHVHFLFIAIGQSEAAGLPPGNEIHDQSKQYRQGKKHECKTREETKEGGSK